jgi:hypothetical protein
MRLMVFLVTLACIVGCYGCGHMKAGTRASATSVAQPSANSLLKSTAESPKGSAKVDFQTQVKPIMEARCQPCHFSGGKVYKEMPFDRAETIKILGTKLFTRIKDENERRVISSFLAQP